MPFSAFSRCGNGFRCSSATPAGKTIYESVKRSYGTAYANENFDGPMSSRWFAKAMTVARAQAELERARNQADPLKCYDLLAAHLADYGVVVEPDATLAEKRAAFAAAKQIPLGPRRGNVEYQLRTALGDDFVAWVTTDAGPETSFPDHPWQWQGIFNDPALWKTIRLRDSIAFTGTSMLVEFEHVSGDDGGLIVGDKLLVEPGELGQQELITVTQRFTTSFRTTFRRPHGAGAIAIRRPWPFWCSNSLRSAVVVRNGRASDPTVRSTATRVLRKLLGNSSTWAVVEENPVAGTAGPHVPGSVIPGITPLGALSF